MTSATRRAAPARHHDAYRAEYRLKHKSGHWLGARGGPRTDRGAGGEGAAHGRHPPGHLAAQGDGGEPPTGHQRSAHRACGIAATSSRSCAANWTRAVTRRRQLLLMDSTLSEHQRHPRPCRAVTRSAAIHCDSERAVARGRRVRTFKRGGVRSPLPASTRSARAGGDRSSAGWRRIRRPTSTRGRWTIQSASARPCWTRGRRVYYASGSARRFDRGSAIRGQSTPGVTGVVWRRAR